MRRIGVQIIGNAVDKQVVNTLATAPPAVVVLSDPDIGTVEQMPTTTTLVGRIVDNSITAPTMTASVAQRFAETVVRKADDLDGQITIWQSANEPLTGAGDNLDEIRRVRDFDVLFAEYLHKEGFLATSSAFGTGKPQAFNKHNEINMKWWNAYLNDIIDILNVHEYFDTREGLAWGWQAGRLAKVWPHLPEYIREKPILISEVGIEPEGWHNISTQRYINILKQYLFSMPIDCNWAATIFAISDLWPNFDIRGDMLRHLGLEWVSSDQIQWPEGIVSPIEQREEDLEFAFKILTQVYHNLEFAMHIIEDNL